MAQRFYNQSLSLRLAGNVNLSKQSNWFSIQQGLVKHQIGVDYEI